MSAILSADDLNDFISPGVACIKPVESLPATETGEVEIQIDDQGNPLEISKIDGKVAALLPAQISLADCLACSGCITSAEEVLVAQHSHDQLLKALREGHKTFVASISHQSRASLAQAYGYSVEQMDRILVDFFVHRLGFKYVVGTALGRKLSLLEESQKMAQRANNATASGPVLSSVCPGWVLYAEKTHPYVLPYMSDVKSPQQITGCLLKNLATQELGVSRDQIYHLSIMPCFDKKLESARPELVPVDADSPDVDCVLTAKELINLVDQSEFLLIPENGVKQLEMHQLIDDVYRSAAPQNWPFKELCWSNDSGSQSGGYAYNYLQLTRNRLLAANPEFSLDEFSIVTVEGRNSDIYELRLMQNGSKVASAAVVNGFRNIQNLVRKLKPSPNGKTTKANPLASRRRARVSKSASASPAPEDGVDASKCDYVEIMACPSGCINGGGQISAPDQSQEKEWLSEIKDIYNQIEMADLSSPDSGDLVDQLQKWSNAFCAESDIPEQRLYATQFNEVEKPTDPNAILLGAKW